jgi:flagellar hook-length control protein FliK
MSNLSITTTTSASRSDTDYTPLTGNAATDNSSETGSAQASFAELISAHMVSTTGLPEEQAVLPQADRDRHIDATRTGTSGVAVTAAVRSLHQDTEIAAAKEPADNSATPDASGMLASMMNQVTAAKPVITDGKSVPVARLVTHNPNSIPAHQPPFQAQAVRAGNVAPDTSTTAKAPHPAELADEPSAPAAQVAAPRIPTSVGVNLQQNADSDYPLQQRMKSVAAEAPVVSTVNKQAGPPAPQLALETAGKAERSPALTTAPPGQVVAQMALHVAESSGGTAHTDRSANTSEVSRTVGPQPDQAADLVTPGAHRSDVNRPPVTLNVATPMVNREWPAEFSQKIVWMGDNKHQVAELHLNPPDLGPLDVVLKVSGNHATAQFTSAHSAVRDAVENAIPRLREILAENGVTLGNTSVSDQTPQFRNADGSANQNFSGNTRQDGSLLSAATSDSKTSTAPAQTIRQHNGLVDTFA